MCMYLHIRRRKRKERYNKTNKAILGRIKDNRRVLGKVHDIVGKQCMETIMKQIDKQYLCYTCAGCLREENEDFKGVYRCKNYMKKERAKENEKQSKN